jgi:hypothetical protein
VALALLVLFSFATAVAQEATPPLEPGTRVWVTAPGLGLDKEAATFDALRGDSRRARPDTDSAERNHNSRAI